MTKAPGKRIIVALDATAPVRLYLQAAAELAQLLQAELHILFLLNDEIKQLAELPFAVEIAVQSRDVRNLSPEKIERQQRSRSRQAQGEFERVLRQARLRGSFKTVWRPAQTILFKQRESGDIVWISRNNPLQLRPPGPRFRHTLYAVYHSSEAGKHTLALARRLRRRGYRHVVLFVSDDIDAPGREYLNHENVELQQLEGGLEQLMSRLENRSSNSLLIADDAPLAQDRDALLSALASCRLEALVVH